MYSVVLMMALAGGEAAPAFGGRGCKGCYGCNGCYSCASCGGGYSCGGCYSSCGGCWGCNSCKGGGLFRKRCHGCNGCNGCYSSCHGCHGGCYGGCYGSSYAVSGCGGYGGYGCGAGCGAPVVVPAPVAPVAPAAPAKGAPKASDKEASLPAPATILVSIPAEAKLTIDDQATTSTAATRVFTSPVLVQGQEFTYTLKATIVRDGRELSTTKVVPVRAGEETRVSIEFPTAVVAQK